MKEQEIRQQNQLSRLSDVPLVFVGAGLVPARLSRISLVDRTANNPLPLQTTSTWPYDAGVRRGRWRCGDERGGPGGGECHEGPAALNRRSGEEPETPGNPGGRGDSRE